MDPQPAMRSILLNSINIFFNFVPVGNTIWTTFSHDDNVLILWGIVSAKCTMMVESVAEAWSVASLDFFVSELQWNWVRWLNV